MTEQQILDDYPELKAGDFRAVYELAAKLGRRVASSPQLEYTATRVTVRKPMRS